MTSNCGTNRKRNDVSIERAAEKTTEKQATEKQQELRELETQNASLTTEVDVNRVKWVQKAMFSQLNERFQPYRDIVHEFKGLKDYKPPMVSSTVSKKNPDKNRYGDQMCIDKTRVILKDRDADHDYINASWMAMPDGRRWISTQGPTKETIVDFWHMVYTENVRVICMLCSFTEDGMEKSREYFNQGGRRDVFDVYRVKVKTKAVEVYPGIKWTVLELEKKSGKSVIVHHLWHTGWVDHFCPNDTVPCVNMFKMAIEKSEREPIVVHCSAGVGRTSTFVGIDYASQKIDSNPDIRMLEIFHDLRKMRLRAIQSPLQYAFLHQCTIERFAQEGSIKRDENFEKTRQCFESMVKKLIKSQSAQKQKYYDKMKEKEKEKEKKDDKKEDKKEEKKDDKEKEKEKEGKDRTVRKSKNA